MQFRKEPFPELAKLSIESAGGMPVGYWVYENDCRDRIVVMLSLDPSGDNGSLERHVSVSMSHDEQRVSVPRYCVREALKLCNIWEESDVVYSTSGVVHCFVPA